MRQGLRSRATWNAFAAMPALRHRASSFARTFPVVIAAPGASGAASSDGD